MEPYILLLYNFGLNSWMNKRNIHSKTPIGYLERKKIKIRLPTVGWNLRAFC